MVSAFFLLFLCLTVKLRLRACLIINGRATCIRKGFNIRLPTEFADSIVNEEKSSALIFKDHVLNNSELILTFRPPIPASLDKPEVFHKVGVRPVQWKILAYFVLILEDMSGQMTTCRRVRAIGSCCLGSNAHDVAPDIQPLLSNVASESSQYQVSQWLHIE